MDWSLLDPNAKHRFLRQQLAYKSTWPYYIALIIDPLIRFNWIFYAIYTEDVQHSTIVSFLVGFTEVCRRGMWMVFRVENEHCTNVGRFRASRDAPLPYEVESLSTPTLTSESGHEATPQDQQEQHVIFHTPAEPTHGALSSPIPAQTSGADIERVSSHPITAAESLRRRRTQTPTSPWNRALTRVGTLLHTAHAQDFERKRRPEDVVDDDDDEEEGESDSEPERPSNGHVTPQQRTRSQSTPAHHDEPDISDIERGPEDDSEDEEATEGGINSQAANRDDIRQAEGALNAAGRG